MNILGYIIAALFVIPAIIGAYIGVKITNGRDAYIDSVEIEPWSVKFNVGPCDCIDCDCKESKNDIQQK